MQSHLCWGNSEIMLPECPSGGPRGSTSILEDLSLRFEPRA